MAQDDFSGVTATLDATTYNSGQTMTLTVTGQDKHTADPVTNQEQASLSLVVQTESGGTATLSIPPFIVFDTTPGVVTMEDVVITEVTDSTGRVWTIGGDGTSATAVA